MSDFEFQFQNLYYSNLFIVNVFIFFEKVSLQNKSLRLAMLLHFTDRSATEKKNPGLLLLQQNA